MSEMKKCMQCGAELPSDALFCPECGTRQNAVETAPAAATAAADPANSASYDPFASVPASATPSPLPFQQQTAAIEQPAAPPVQPARQPVQQPVQPVQQSMPQTQPAASFQYAVPPQQNPQGPAYPQQMTGPSTGNQPFPQPAGVNAAGKPVKDPAKAGKKLPVYVIAVVALLALGLIYWFFRFYNSNLPPYNFGEGRSTAVVFSFLLMSVVSTCSAIILRVQTRGSKFAIVGNILLALTVLVMLYGITMTEFLDKNLLYKLFLNFTK